MNQNVAFEQKNNIKELQYSNVNFDSIPSKNDHD